MHDQPNIKSTTVISWQTVTKNKFKINNTSLEIMNLIYSFSVYDVSYWVFATERLSSLTHPLVRQEEVNMPTHRIMKFWSNYLLMDMLKNNPN
jgi:hypothetical protein